MEPLKVSYVLSTMEAQIDQKILEKAVEFFMKFGVKSVSMDDIARGLGISKKTLYQEVESKADLLQQALLFHLEFEKTFVTNARKDAADAVEEMVTISKFIINILRQHKPSLTYEMQKYYPQVWEMIEAFNKEFIGQFVFENITAGMTEGYYRDDIDPIVIQRLYIARLQVLVDHDIFPIDEFPRAELYEQFITHHMRGMMTDKGVQRFEQILAQ